MDQSRVTVILCAYTEARWDDLCRAVESLRRQTRRPEQIVLVVDHNDALLARAHAEWNDVETTPNQEARGLAGARNTGVRATNADVLVFLDDDARADDRWLARLLAGLDDPQVLGVGGSITPDWPLGRRPRWFPEEFDWVVGGTYRGMPERASSVRNLIGASMAFRREVFDQVGGFVIGMGRIGTLPLGCEETELCIRARQRWPERHFLYDPDARVLHTVPSSRATWRYFVARCYAEGRSKARVAALVGADQGLESERAYVWRVLPLGVARGIFDAARHRDPSGLARAAAIVLGLACTTAGYLVQRGLDIVRRDRAHVPATSESA